MRETIIRLLREYKQDSDLAITDESTFEEIGLDSLDTVELVMNLEEELGVTIELSESIRRVGDLIELLESRK